MAKYLTVKVGGEMTGVVTRIVKATNIEGYTEGVLEIFFPEEGMTHKQEREWAEANNKRMEAICKFLNENDL